MKKTTVISAFILLIGFAQHSFGDVMLSSPDINTYLKGALEQDQINAKKEQKRTGGVLLAAGGVLIAASMASTIVGNDYSIGAAPGVLLATGGAFSLGGLLLLFHEQTFEKNLQSYKAIPEWKLEDINEKVTKGEDLLNQQSIIAERERWWGGSLTFLAGAANIILGDFLQSNTGTPRESMQSAGYFFGGLGLVDMVYENRLWAGGSMALLGVSNLTVYHIDPRSPSTDYLYISGGLVAASGLVRLFTPLFAENAEERFRDFIKRNGVSLNTPDLFLLPTADGMMAGLRASF